MKLKAVKVYQAVEFCRKLETFFVENDTRMKGLVAEVFVVEGVAVGVKLQTADDEIIVPFTNIAYMKCELSDNDKKNKGREPKLGDQAPYRGK